MYNEPLDGIPLYRAASAGKRTHAHTLSLCRRTANDGAQERREKNSSECMCDAIPDGAWYSEHPAKLKIDRINRVARTIH